jgi:hypothetical protein
MAVGLIIGIDAEPAEEQIRGLLDEDVVESQGSTFEAPAVSAAEAADRDRLRDLFKAARAKHGWLQGPALSDDLVVADLVVQGQRSIVAGPPVASPAASQGGPIAGIGFTPIRSLPE